MNFLILIVIFLTLCEEMVKLQTLTKKHHYLFMSIALIYSDKNYFFLYDLMWQSPWQLLVHFSNYFQGASKYFFQKLLLKLSSIKKNMFYHNFKGFPNILYPGNLFTSKSTYIFSILFDIICSMQFVVDVICAPYIAKLNIQGDSSAS